MGISLGALTEVTGTRGVTLGRQFKVTHEFSVAIGYHAQTTFANQFKVRAKHMKVDNTSTRSMGGVRFHSRLSTNGKQNYVPYSQLDKL